MAIDDIARDILESGKTHADMSSIQYRDYTEPLISIDKSSIYEPIFTEVFVYAKETNFKL